MLPPNMNMGLNHCGSSSMCCCALLVLLLCLATCHTEAADTLLHRPSSTTAPSRHPTLQSQTVASESQHPLHTGRRLQDATSTATYFIGPSRFTSAFAISKGSATPVGSAGGGAGGGGGGGSGAAAPARSAKLVRTGQAVPKTSYSLDAEVAKDVLEIPVNAGKGVEIAAAIQQALDARKEDLQEVLLGAAEQRLRAWAQKLGAKMGQEEEEEEEEEGGSGAEKPAAAPADGAGGAASSSAAAPISISVGAGGRRLLNVAKSLVYSKGGNTVEVATAVTVAKEGQGGAGDGGTAGGGASAGGSGGGGGAARPPGSGSSPAAPAAAGGEKKIITSSVKAEKVEVKQLVAQDLLQLQQDVRAILKVDQKLEARQRLAEVLRGKKEGGGGEEGGGGGSGAGSAGAAGKSSSAGPPAAVVLDVQPAPAATSTASASAPAGNDTGATGITSSPAVQVVGGPPGSPNSTLNVNLDQLVAQIRAGQIVGEPDGRGGSTITIGDGSGQQPGANMTRSLMPGTANSTITGSGSGADIMPAAQREVQLAVRGPGAGAGDAPEQRTITVTAAAGMTAEQLKPGIVQGLQQALAQLGLVATDSGQLESVADILATQLDGPAEPAGDTGVDNLPPGPLAMVADLPGRTGPAEPARDTGNDNLPAGSAGDAAMVADLPGRTGGHLVDHLSKAVLDAVANSSAAQQQEAGGSAGGHMAEAGKDNGRGYITSPDDGQHNSGRAQQNGGGCHRCWLASGAAVQMVVAMMAALLLL